ncbi:Cytochrome c oxidase subunit 2 precursor [Variovorax sp. PBS-H4]|uniref:c-type cytochrome n=1 Tax=Variovorax sp. PBS-H4 TaxID=434008 RepID=UPI001315FAB6|nr:c-type cytochrome [Variovorax sp. PBS-H4]VTU31606.1 Cytochrome c oxidase subunit 2 precursor [Variovorax sp. PBS-H4]
MALSLERHGPRTTLLLALVPLALAGGCVKESGLPYADAPRAQRLRGQALVAQYQCGSCHVIPDVPAARGRAGPALGGFGRRSYIAGEVPNRPDVLAQWIVQPKALVPDTLMPPMGVSADQARDMAAFLLALE